MLRKVLLTAILTLTVWAAVAGRAHPTVAAPIDVAQEQWDDQFGYPGVSGTVHAVVVAGDDVYVGGEMLRAGEVESGSILRWDGSRWHNLGGGLTRPSYLGGEGNGTVRAIAVSGGNVYAGGNFTKAGGQEAHNIAVWNGQSWSALGGGISTGSSVEAATVNAIAVDGNDIYVGGSFNTAGSTAVAGIARWSETGQSWAALGSGLGGAAYIDPFGIAQAIAVGPDGIYVGGDFQTAGGNAAPGIARWNPQSASWSTPGGGVLSDGYPGYVRALAVDGTRVYAAGWFDTAGPTAAANVALWDSAAGTWSALGAGLAQTDIMGQVPVLALALDGGQLYAGGNFTQAGGVAANHIALWDGNTWQPLLEDGSNGTGATVNALATAAGALYAGGEFIEAGPKSVFYIGRWDGSQWSALGQGVEVPTIYALATNQHGEVYAGGLFSHAGGVPVNNVARWDGQRWHALGSGTDGAVTALAVSGDDLYAAGYFTQAGGREAFYIAHWNERSQSWSPLGAGLGYYAEALALDGNTLYVGGHFVTAGGQLSEALARYDLASGRWSSLGSRLYIDDPQGDVYALLAFDGYLIAGGSFATVNLDGQGGIPANGLVVWDSIRDDWYTIQEAGVVGVDAFAVYALALAGDELFVGGTLSSAGPVSTRGVARYDLATGHWAALGSGLGGSFPDVHALASDGQWLYAGGSFDSAGGLAANNIARWNLDTGTWSALDGGVGGRTGPAQENDIYVEALSVAGADLFAGGSFRQAGGLPSHNVARWLAAPPSAATTVTPAAGGTLASANLTVRFPPASVDETLALSATPLSPAVHPFAGGQSGLRAWSLQARAATGQLVSHFRQPVELTFSYTDAELAALGVDEQNLNVAYWNGTRWVNLLPCAGCAIDTAANTITVFVDHFTIFALTAGASPPPPPPSGAYNAYLPLVIR